METKSQFVAVHYIVATGGSGLTRMYLWQLPAWIDANPGALVYKITTI